MQTAQTAQTQQVTVSQAVYLMFVDTIHLRKTLGDTAWRKTILLKAEFEWGCTQASAASMYNNAKKRVTAETPALVIGLGRAEGKNNGGRKRVINIDAAAQDLRKSQNDADVIDVDAKFVDDVVADTALLLTNDVQDVVQADTVLLLTNDVQAVAKTKTKRTRKAK